MERNLLTQRERARELSVAISLQKGRDMRIIWLSISLRDSLTFLFSFWPVIVIAFYEPVMPGFRSPTLYLLLSPISFKSSPLSLSKKS